MALYFKQILIIILLTFMSSFSAAQDKILRLDIEGAKYDSLFVYDFREVPNRCKIRGVNQSSNVWIFTIPDSIYRSLPEFEIIPNTFDFETNTSSRIRFISTINNDSCFTDLLNFQDDETYIKAKYYKTVNYDSLRFYIQLPNKKYKAHIIGKMKTDYLIADCDTTSDLYIRMLEPYYSKFLDIKDKGYDYNGFVTYYLTLAKRYPSSRYLLLNLATNLDKYIGRKDVCLLYNALSDKYKDTIFGKNIQRYIKNHFDNDQLLSMQNRLEPIITDSTIYNLIVFSASWCGPCHKQIPYLKDIYNKLKGRIEITYISLDKKETMSNWKKLINKEEIPWRSLFAGEKINYIKDKYYVKAIPQTILVAPSMSKIILDVRKNEDRTKLFEMVK